MVIDDELFRYLIGLKKEFKDNGTIMIGPPPMKWSRDIQSLETKDIFILDYYRGEVNLKKYSINKRYRTVIPILRICSQGAHTNPDGTKFKGPHLHIYKEGYEDKIAHPISYLGLEDDCSIEDALLALLKYVNIQILPIIQTSLS